MQENKKGVVYLIPAPLHEKASLEMIPFSVKKVIHTLDTYIVENEKTARRYLRDMGIKIPLGELVFYTLNKHTSRAELASFLEPLEKGKSIGIISEAGCPGIADPGAEIVSIAHEKNIRVIPLPGPSSILMALMGSGLNGQSFVFHGYLPIRNEEKIRKIRELEIASEKHDQTQIFIETPFRNNQLLESLLKTCKPQTCLCIACNITADDEFMVTKTISLWKEKLPDLHKKPTVFLLYRRRR